MKFLHLIAAAGTVLLVSRTPLFAEIKIVVEHNDNGSATGQFKFKDVPAPSKTDAATKAKFAIVEGERDENGAELSALHDGKLPLEEDQPDANFFFDAGTKGGRLLIDLGSVIALKQVNTYSWHPNTRGPQVYKLFASDGTAAQFQATPGTGADPLTNGWKLIANVDTRSRSGDGGGQYGVSISDSEGAIGLYRYLLFDIVRTEADDDFGNTFYSEIDVIQDQPSSGAHGNAGEPAASAGKMTCQSEGGKYQITIDSSQADDLTEWADMQLAPVVQQWYPKLVAFLPSEGYEAPQSISITFQKGQPGIPAATGGTHITCNSDWFRRNLDGEAKGAVVHELVHIIQQYRHARRSDPNALRTPGWLVEGIPDYLRWFKYEPQNHGADATWMRGRRNLSLNYDRSYRITANFLNWVFEHYDKNSHLLIRLNTACRQGKYSDDLWKEWTGKTLPDLNDEWKAAVRTEIASANPPNTSQ